MFVLIVIFVKKIVFNLFSDNNHLNNPDEINDLNGPNELNDINGLNGLKEINELTI